MDKHAVLYRNVRLCYWPSAICKKELTSISIFMKYGTPFSNWHLRFLEYIFSVPSFSSSQMLHLRISHRAGLEINSSQTRNVSRINKDKFIFRVPRKFGPFSPQHGATSGYKWGKPPDTEGSFEKSVLNRKSRTVDKGWSFSLGASPEVLTTKN